MEHIFFYPWIGKDYESGGMFGKKILVIGESHHCEDCDECNEAAANPDSGVHNFSRKVVQEIIDGKSDSWTGTFRKFERSLVGHETSVEDSRKIWESLAFYNYLQVAVDKARKAGKQEDYDKSELAFYEVLNELQPDLIIVWGVTRMYDNMPFKGWEKSEDIVIDGYHVLNGYYTIDSGKKIRAIWVYHPSTSYSWNWWNKVIKTVL